MGNKIKKWLKENKNEIAFVGYTSAILAGFAYTMFNLGRLDERIRWYNSSFYTEAEFNKKELDLIKDYLNNTEVKSYGNDIQTDRDI